MKYFICYIFMVSAFSIYAHDSDHEHNFGHVFSTTTYYTSSGSTTLDDDFVASRANPSKFNQVNMEMVLSNINHIVDNDESLKRSCQLS